MHDPARDLSRYRGDFPVMRHATFLDNASIAPISLRVKRRIDDWAADALNTARPAVDRWFARVADTRRLAARLLGCRPEEVAFASSTGMALSLFGESLDWRPADSIVTAANEFPSNMYPWLNLKRRGVHVKAVRPDPRGRLLIDDLVAAIDGRTRLMSVSWVGFNTGFRIDVERLAAECRRRGVHLVIDAIQGLGALPFDATAWGVAAAAADAHKWLLGPEGTALLYVRRDLAPSLHPPLAGWKSVREPMNFLRYDFLPVEDASRFEPGSYNTVGIYGLYGALELLLEAGIDAVTARVRDLTDYLVGRLETAGVEVRSPRGQGEWSGIVSFAAPGGDGPAAQRALAAKGVICTGRADFLRASPHFYNTREDVDRLIGALGA